ncbi:hypothetical protein FRC17_002781 [Serendipita sp. 399]|nr:hypothetical protein FRC17_002781 [Serendipita sp. 399]
MPRALVELGFSSSKREEPGRYIGAKLELCPHPIPHKHKEPKHKEKDLARMDLLEEMNEDESHPAHLTLLYTALNAAPLATLRNQLSELSPILLSFSEVKSLGLPMRDSATRTKIRELLKPFQESIMDVENCLNCSFHHLKKIHSHAAGQTYSPNCEPSSNEDIEDLYAAPKQHAIRLRLLKNVIRLLNKAKENLTKAQSKVATVAKAFRAYQKDCMKEYTISQRWKWLTYFDDPPLRSMVVDLRSASAMASVIADKLERSPSNLSSLASFIEGMLLYSQRLNATMQDPTFLDLLRSSSVQDLCLLNEQRHIGMKYISKMEEDLEGIIPEFYW